MTVGSIATIPTPKSVGEPTLSPEKLQVLPHAQPTATPLAENTADPNFASGKAAYQRGEFEEAIRLLSAAIDADSSLAPPYLYRGAALRYLGRYDEALTDLNMALSIISDYALAYAHRSTVLFSTGNVEEALMDSEEALKSIPFK